MRRIALASGLLALAACTTPAVDGGTSRPSAEPHSPTGPGASSAPASGSPTPEPTVDPKPARSFTVTMSGDVLLHEGLWYTAQADAERTGRGRLDFRPTLADMRGAISDADLAICHLETPLAPPDGPFAGYPVFSVPPQIAPALEWVGYDACTTASNHTLDQGFDGVVRTLDVLDRARVAHTGSARTRPESRRILQLRVQRVRVALLSYSYGTNGIPVPEDQPWSVNLIDRERILDHARRARRQGADVVLVALHWGLEYQNEPTPDQVDLGNALLRSSDVDLVYGHHAHVVQPFDRVGGEWVAYGLGNALAQQSTEVAGLYDGVTARFTFRERANGAFRVTRARYVPTYTTPELPMRWLNVLATQDAASTSAALAAELRAAQRRIATEVDLLEATGEGLRRAR